MILEERTYVLSPCYSLQDYLEPYQRLGLPIQRRVLGGLLGGYTTEVGALHSLVHLWSYSSFEDRLERRARLAIEPAWLDCLAIIRPMISTMNNRLLVPTDYSPSPPEGSA